MKKKRTYHASRVQDVRVPELLPLVAAGCIVALDVAKQKFFVAIATLAGEVLKLFRFDHPTETSAFLDVVKQLRAGCPAETLTIAMEPTGTYGDAIRHQLVSAGFRVQMISPKLTHDSQAIFDGVQSLHDPKSATLIAALCSLGRGTTWTTPPPVRVRLRALVERRQYEHRRMEHGFGRIEGQLARHFPEFGQWLDVREQKTALRLLSVFPSPEGLRSAGAATVVDFVRKSSRGSIAKELCDGITKAAATTLGVPMMAEEEDYLALLASDADAARRRAEQVEFEMEKLEQEDEAFANLAKWMGTWTAAVMITLADPRQYTKARQLEKACGLNLREKSSGEMKGRLSITKRGPSLTRQVLYLFALRMIQQSSTVRAWYMARKGYTEDSKQRAVVAVMRKLVRAVFHVARGHSFDAAKLFDQRRLKLVPSTSRAPGMPSARKTQRSTVRGKSRARENAEVRV